MFRKMKDSPYFKAAMVLLISGGILIVFYNLVVNTNHPLIQELVEKETSEEVQEEVEKDGKKETVVKTVYSLSGEEERLKQLIDIALLASGRLKGEALAKFVNRSVELMGR